MNNFIKIKKFQKKKLNNILIPFLMFFLISGCSVIEKVKSDFEMNTIQTTAAVISESSVNTPQISSEDSKDTKPQSGVIIETLEPTPAVYSIQLWVPPQFDVEKETPGGVVLSEIISDYTEQNPNINITTRVKSSTGESSMINTIIAADHVAQDTLPSLAIMSRNDMETAVQRGLIQPFSTSIFSDNSTWYNYASQSAMIDETIYGIPILGDGLVLIYNSDKIESLPGEWQGIMERGFPIGFAPASSTSPFGTFVYLGLGGSLTNDLGQINLDQQKLTDTLTFFYNGNQSGIFPASMTQNVDLSQVWQRYNDGTISAVIVPYSSYKEYAVLDSSIQRLPVQPGIDEYPLVRTWNLVLLEKREQNQAEVIKFAEYLADPAVNDKMSSAMGYFPVRNMDHDFGSDNPQYSVIEKICMNGKLLPGSNIMNKVVPVINNAINQVLKNQAAPEDAANEAINSLN